MSSVGPLGYCRLTTVDTSQGTHKRRPSGYPDSSKASSSPGVSIRQRGMMMTITSTTSPSLSWAPEIPGAETITTTSHLHQLLITPTKSPLQTSGPPNDFQREWSLPGTHYTTLSFQAMGSTVPGGAEDVGVSEGRSLETSESVRSADKNISHTKKFVFDVTETYMRVVQGKRDKDRLRTFQEKKRESDVTTGTEISKDIEEHETAIMEERRMVRLSQKESEAGHEVDNVKEFMKLNVKNGESGNTEHKDVINERSKKRRIRKRKKKRRNKKNRTRKYRKEMSPKQVFSGDNFDRNTRPGKDASTTRSLVATSNKGVMHSDTENDIVALFHSQSRRDEQDYYSNGECICTYSQKIYLIVYKFSPKK